MKVVLKHDVKGLGREGDLKEVKDGYARNYLLPHKAAVMADKTALAEWERTRSKREDRDRQLRADAEATAARLSALTITAKVKAGEKDRLFGSVTNREIADLIRESGMEIDRHQIHLREPIKTIGEHRVEVRVAPGVEAQVTVTVVPERSSTRA